MPTTTTPGRGAAGGLRLRRESLLVLGTVAVLLGIAAALAPTVAETAPFLPGTAVPWWALALAFAATEVSVLTIQVNREARSVSLSELPLVLGLFFASPLALVAGRVIGSAAALVLKRRAPVLKTTFNLALFTAETAVAVAIFRVLAPTGADGLHPWTWIAAYAGALVANILGGLAIGVVISIYDGGLRPVRLARDAVSAAATAPMVVTLALVAVTSLSAAVESAWLLVAFGALILLAYRGYASLADRHLNLERLYRFSQAVTSAPEIDGVLTSVLGEAKELLRSERASVGFVSEGGHVARVRLGAGNRLFRTEEPPNDVDAWLLRRVVEDGESQLFARGSRDPAVRRLLDQHAMREAVAVPLRGAAGVIGVLLVADRLGDVRTYDHGDVLLLETVANHAGVALQNGQLIGQLRHDAQHDALTGLPNRAFLQRALTGALDAVAAGGSPGAAVMILDLDEFKGVNETLGHQQGDRLLVEVGARLTTAVGTAGTVVRLGGDEFAVVVPGTADEDRVLHLGRRMVRALEQPVALDGLEVEIGASVGVALAPLHGTDPATLLKRADRAMYDAKISTRRLRLYEPELDNENPRRLTLVSALRTALQDGGISVVIQPQARLATGEVVGGEALVRWDHPELGPVSPDEFIPVAERSGLIGPLTTLVLDSALAACAQWRAAGADFGVAVNLSARSLHDADLVDEVARLLRRHGVPAGRLTLEVTESSVMADPARAVALLHQLRDLGVRLSVDDFGTGYSSLSYLKRLPVHEVKIDRSFVSGLREQGEDVGIVRAIVDLGRHLGLEVVAEGVEDADTHEMLVDMGCDLVQGWHLARPMPPGEFLPWLATRAHTARRRGLRVV
ncbi:putative bifunctional diguanylate cyclase/phosphodiesterase [Geodermatophilus sp. URMC 64]